MPTTFIRCFATADAARASAPRGSDWQVVCTPAGEPVAFPIEGLAGLIANSNINPGAQPQTQRPQGATQVGPTPDDKQGVADND